MYDAVATICYLLALACFFSAFSKPKIVPATLDLVALGLFFITVPLLVDRL